MLLLSLTGLVSVTLVTCDDKDVFSSTADLSRLLHMEKSFVEHLRLMTEHLEKDLKTIRTFLETSYKNLLELDETYVANPINSLYLIKRLSLDLARSGVTEVLQSNQTEQLRQTARKFTSSFPRHEDWVGAANGIFLLQEHYDLNVTKLAAGVIEFAGSETESEHQLEAEELYQIGVSTVNSGHYDTGIEWLELTSQKIKTDHEKLFMTEDLKLIESRIRDAKKIHDHFLDKAGVIGATHRCNRVPFDEKLRKKKKYKVAKKNREKVKRAKNYFPLYQEVNEILGLKVKNSSKKSIRDNFEDGCNGVQLRTSEMDLGQRCYHLHHNDPFNMLSPFKLEQLSSQPYITVIHQMMTEREMEHFKQYARDKLQRSGHAGRGTDTTSLKRTSKQTWLEHRMFNLNVTEIMEKTGASSPEEVQKMLEDDPAWSSFFMRKKDENITDWVSHRVSQRMERATTFSLFTQLTSEAFQVANYGLGGQYETHLDPHGFWEGKGGNKVFNYLGDRLATIMVYLENVQAGGATAFPNTGLRVAVNKGDAAFWINLRTSGFVDRLTHHGGCPVLVGSKWITNKWVGYLPQFRGWPCSREGPLARFKPFTQYF